MKKLLLILFTIGIKIGFSQSYINYNVSNLNLNSQIQTDDFDYILASPTTLNSQITFTLPPTVGLNGQFLTTLGNGSLTWSTISSTPANPAGANRQVQFNDNGSFGASANFVWEADNQLAIGQASAAYSLDVNGNLQTGFEGTDGEFRIFSEQGGTDYELVFRPNDAMTQSTTYTWPSTDGPNGDILVTDGNGNLYWTTDGVTGSFPCVGQGTGGGSGNEADGDNSFVGGGSSNEVTGQASNAFIGGGVNNEAQGDRAAIAGGTNNNLGSGADQATIGAGDNNEVLGDDSIIGAGANNFIDDNPGAANGQATEGQNFIGAGSDNRIISNNSAIMAGFDNDIEGNNSDEVIIGAGHTNLVDVSERSAIMSGRDNTIDDGDRSAISSGQNNTISDNDSFIGAGRDNTVSNNESGIAGGRNNEVTRENAVILGGRDNLIGSGTDGDFSFAFGRGVEVTGDFGIGIGRRAIVNDEGAGAFTDANDQDLTTSSTDRMEMRFSNGYIFYSNNAFTQGLQLLPGANSWSSLSDSTMKENIIKLNDEIVFDNLMKLQISSWNYKSDYENNERNYGPMAQDFYRLFGSDQFGEFASDTTIIPMHLTSIGLSGTKALLNKIDVSQKEIENLTNEQVKIEEELYKLELKIMELEKRLSSK